MRRKPVRRAGVALTLRRRPRLRTGLVVVIALLCGTAVARTVQQAEDTRAAWGRSATVLVATRGPRRRGPARSRQHRGVAPRPAPLVPAGALDGRSRGRDGSPRPSTRARSSGRSGWRRPAHRRWRLASPPELGRWRSRSSRAPRLRSSWAIGSRCSWRFPPRRPAVVHPASRSPTDVAVVDVTETAVTIAVDRRRRPAAGGRVRPGRRHPRPLGGLDASGRRRGPARRRRGPPGRSRTA